MASQVLFYEQAVAVSPERHHDWSVETGGSYAFARRTNSVPLMAVEFARAAQAYPIVFAGEKSSLLPMAVLGLRDRENTFITEKGGWSAEYIPAFVRRYPFIFATGDGGKNFTLCLDESYAGCNQEGRGDRLFGEDRKPTEFVQRVLDFLREYERQYQLTRMFTARLAEFGLLEPVQASVAFDSGEKVALNGLSVVNRERLKSLAPERLAELAKKDLLELSYVHLHSLSNFGSMVGRSSNRAPAASATSRPVPGGKAPAAPKPAAVDKPASQVDDKGAARAKPAAAERKPTRTARPRGSTEG